MERANHMTKIQGMQKNASCIGCLGEIGVENKWQIKIEKIFNYNIVSPYIHWIWLKQLFKFGGILGWRVEQTFDIVGNPIKMWKAQRFKTQCNFNGESLG